MEPQAFLPAPERPLMIQRLSKGHEAPEVWDNFFPELKRNRECCDELWFSTGVGNPALDDHRRRSALMAIHAEELRKIGIIPSLQIQSTIGHSDAVGLANVNDAKTWGSYVGIHGEQCRFINCPRQPEFLDYMRQMSEIYAQWKPASVWIDDDLRIQNHAPASAPGGCCCPYCLEQFSLEEGKTYSREDIEKAYEENSELKVRWNDFSERSLQMIAEAIISGFRKYAPETRFALQHCDSSARLKVFDIMYQVSGGKIASRPGGGAYTDHYPYWILNKGILCSQQMFSQQGYEKMWQVCPEIESCPRMFTCKTSHGHRLESLYYLALGMDSLSYYIMSPNYETQEWYGENLLAPLAKEAECYRNFIRHNENTLPTGIGLCSPLQHPRADIVDLGLPLIGVPFGTYSSKVNCYQITAKAAEELPLELLEAALRNDLLLDGAATEVICKRGLGNLIGGISTSPAQARVEIYTDDPFNDGLDIKRHLTMSQQTFKFDIPTGVNARVIGRYEAFSDDNFTPATVLLERPDGTRVAFIGYAGFDTTYISSSRVRLLNRIADWVTHGKMPVQAEEPVQCLMIPRISPDGMLRSVAIVNVTIGNQKPFDLHLRNIPANAEVEWQIPAEQPQKLELKSVNGKLTVTIPAIAPWDIGWLKISF